jgi:putative membrane-bound dehydrogenase-like protein
MKRALLAAVFLSSLAPAQESAREQAEKRFPPLQVPAGFKASLFACDPLVEYPSVIARGPRPGSLYVAYDYMTGLGTEIVRRDEVRLVEDTDGDGFADRSTLYAGGFNSIQGLEHHGGAVYVMHAPYLTLLRDADGDGAADERRDLFKGFGWDPEKAPDRLHMANGLLAGHDGWLYLALGDRGVDTLRPEGDRLVLHGGGILRCRPDGRDLHVFSTGLRNIYDVALDEDLNVFVRDNENDGGTYMIRVCLSFPGADHGYPYLYEEHPDEALKPIADLGRGSSAGGACYLETAFPAEYQGDLFFCEWGRSVVRYRRERSGATFATPREIEFAAGAASDPYGFKPTDIVVDRDGSLLVSDWGDGQRPRRGRGRIYRIAYPGASPPAAAPSLDSRRHSERVEAQAALERANAPVRPEALGVLGRLHAVWILARRGDRAALFGLAERDPEPRVRAQAVRALADLTDPVLVARRLDAGPGDAAAAERLAAVGRGQDPRVVLEVLVALGRLRWDGTPGWIRANLPPLDPALAHAAQQALRASRNWPAVLALLDEPDAAPVRAVALRALAWQAEAAVADGLIDRLKREADPRRRREYADLLARAWKKPAPWVYWGFRPAPRPPHAAAWERTDAIERALDAVLADADPGVRRAALRRLKREGIPARAATLVPWLRAERDAESVAAILESLKAAPAEPVRDALAEVIRDGAHAAPNRLAALEIFGRGLDADSERRLLEIAGAIEDSPVAAEVFRRLGARPKLDAEPLLLRKLASPLPEVRAAAIDALTERRSEEARRRCLALLKDPDIRVVRSAVPGCLPLREAVEDLLALAVHPDGELRRRCLRALGRLREPRALPVALAALRDRETELAALECVAEVGGPGEAAALAEFASKSGSLAVLDSALRTLARWEGGGAIAEVQGATGALLVWKASGPMSEDAASKAVEAGTPPGGARTVFAAGPESRVAGEKGPEGGFGTAFAEASVTEPTRAQFLASSSGTLEVWLNGRRVYRRAERGPFRADSDRFEAELAAGVNRIAVHVPASAEFHLRFRRQASTAERERLAQLALAGRGDVKRGRDVFQNVKKSNCLTCHRLGEQGGRVGPDLNGVGRRFSRAYLIESILEPSRAIAPSYQNWAVQLKDGRVLNGVRVDESETTFTLGDQQGQPHVLPKAEIKRQKMLSLSLMPEGLEKALTDQEFVDLVAFLVEQK